MKENFLVAFSPPLNVVIHYHMHLDTKIVILKRISKPNVHE